MNSKRSAQSQRFFNAITGSSAQPIRPIPPESQAVQPIILPKVEINFDALQREAMRRREELDKVSGATQNQLYRLVQGDRAVVARLLQHSRSHYPNQSEQWLWEKTIEDLERDRGYR